MPLQDAAGPDAGPGHRHFCDGGNGDPATQASYRGSTGFCYCAPDVNPARQEIVTTDQLLLFGLLLFVFVFLIWGRWRYDLVAFVALLAALLAGIVPADQAFSGFGHPATVIIALVLIISRGLSNSGVIELLARYFVHAGRSLAAHIGMMSGLAAALSAVMNNVAALALLMPLDLQAAKKSGRSPSLTLMPLSFASILGGMITLIGTPPNIVIAQFRGDALGASYRMFDFAPVGLTCAVVGVAYVALLGWRLLPGDRNTADAAQDLFDLADYIAEAKVPDGSAVIGRRVRDLDDLADKAGVEIVGLTRSGRRLPGLARAAEIRAGDVLVIEASPDSLEEALGMLKLEYVGKGEGLLEGNDLSLSEVVVPESSRLAGRSAISLRLLYRYRVALVGVSRQGRRFRENIRKLDLQPGDVLLLLGPDERLLDVTARLGLLPLADRGQRVIQRNKVWPAVGLFAAAIIAASAGAVYLPIALGCVVAAFVFFNIVPIREVYDSVEWPVIVLLGSIIPIGSALQSTGGTALIAGALVDVSAGFPPVVVLLLLVIVTMTLSDVMNNVATAVIAAPIGIEIATRLNVSPDPFLMGVAVAASCAFLTPIGHKNNTLIMGPGGYRFGDYWRMGLLLELIIVAVSVPTILVVWPL
jgi:di/tricarboxylate transporter